MSCAPQDKWVAGPLARAHNSNMQTISGHIENGKVVLDSPLPEDSSGPVVVCVLSDPEREEWLKASEDSLTKIWDHEDDDVFNELRSS